MKDKPAEPKRLWILSFASVFVLLLSLGFTNGPLLASDYYPPRISKIDGSAAYEPAGEVDWEELTINLPLLSGDRIFSHVDSRIEVDLGQANFLRLGEQTDVSFARLEEKESTLELHSGSMILRINRDHRFRIQTPDGVVSVKRDGLYRIDTSEDRPTEVVVRKGSADIDSASGRARVDSGERMVLAAGPSGKLEVTYGYYEDGLDNWSDRRDASYVSSASVAYVGNTYYPGVWDLDYYGTWDYYPGYGRVWIPRVSVGWVPFRHGRWTYLPHYGYTWVSYDPWGWLPYHYGNWMYWGSRWCWLPGQFSVWAAAPVNFFFGGGYVGWYPRGYYGHGRGGTTIINNNTVIVNNGHTPGPGRRGLTLVRQNDFRYGRSVSRVAETARNESGIQWRSGLPSGASSSFREGRQSVARSDRSALVSLDNGVPRVNGRRADLGSRGQTSRAGRLNESRPMSTPARSSRSVERAGPSVSPAVSRDRSRTSVSGGRAVGSSDVRTYSVGERASSPTRQSQERAVERARSEARSGTSVRTAPATPVAPSSRVNPPVSSGRERTAPSRDSFRAPAPRTGQRTVPQRPTITPNRENRAPSSFRSIPSRSSRPAISRPAFQRPSTARPSFSRPSMSRPSFSRPAAPRPSSQGRPASSSRPSGSSQRTRPNRH